MLKTKEIVIEKGRDAGTKFIITEMPIAKADKWAMKVLLALAGSGIDVPNPQDGMLAIVRVALSAFKNIPEEKFIPLADELLDCVEIVPKGGQPRKLNLEFNDVQDISTLYRLRQEVLMLHIDFLLQDNNPILG
ncbi:hypothetical protein QV09_05540 [Gallibacterium salpingitidis]|uniref:Uncharacterized protein n=1 Tax=Gallibacterium salpingitidis TaxID=505341 RepID=A0AB36E685_9PAST|nr:hypothetical protein [Gallibacterium salpingitidis]OBX10414.1 hypothetical protein QV09_05540 [Gallibacterium salpingitidis]WKT00534.1 hypothetical protein NYR30_04400 [Gallibacterium salpingitidis]